MYKCCFRIEQFAMFLVSGLYEDGIHVSFCCYGSTYKGTKVPGIKFNESAEKTLNDFILLRERLLSEAKAGSGLSKPGGVFSECQKCPDYRESNWEPVNKIRHVSFTMYPSPCNVKCIYCYSCIQHHTSQNNKFDPKLHGPVYEKYFELLELTRKSGLFADDAEYEVAPGEIAIHPYRDRILDFVKGQTTFFLTNCVKYDDRVAQNLKENPKSRIMTSLDAGTSETWRRIKGTDNFLKTIRNIESYCNKAAHPGQVALKYIMLPGINTNAKDYEAITKLIQKLGINVIVIAYDLVPRTEKNLRESIQAAAELLAVMQSKGINVGWDVFKPEHQQEIADIASQIKAPSSASQAPSLNQNTQDTGKKNMAQPQAHAQNVPALINAGKYEEASKILIGLTKVKSSAPAAYYYLAVLSNLTNDPTTAKNLFYKAFGLERNLCTMVLSKEHPNHGYVFSGRKNEEKTDKCPLCERREIVPRWCYCVLDMGSVHGRAFNPVRTWMYCEACHHMFAEEFPSQEAAAASGLQHVGEAMTTNPVFFRYNSEILGRLIAFSQGNELLEIGVGGSEFALVAREMGYNVFALDVSEGNVSQAKKYGIDAHVQDIMTFETDKKWDIIIMGDVIEHVACPVKTMEKASGLLADNGVLWLSTPNFEASFAIVAGHNDPMRREAAHKNYFSRESLLSLLERFNLAPVDYRISGHYNGSMEITAVKVGEQET